MKIICFILSLYVFSLSTVPCCSGNDCSDDTNTEHTQDHSHHHDDNNDNTCSPFLNCGTCSGFVFSKLEIDFEEFYFIMDKSVVVHKSQFIDHYFAKFWQPPKIG